MQEVSVLRGELPFFTYRDGKVQRYILVRVLLFRHNDILVIILNYIFLILNANMRFITQQQGSSL